MLCGNGYLHTLKLKWYFEEKLPLAGNEIKNYIQTVFSHLRLRMSHYFYMFIT